MCERDRKTQEFTHPLLKGYGNEIFSLLEKRNQRISQTRDLTHLLNPYYDKIDPVALLDPKELFRNGCARIVIHNDFWSADPQKYIDGECWDYCALLIKSKDLINSFETINPGEHSKKIIDGYLVSQGYFCDNAQFGEKFWTKWFDPKDFAIEIFLSQKLDQFNLKLRWPSSKGDDDMAPLAIIRAWQ